MIPVLKPGIELKSDKKGGVNQFINSRGHLPNKCIYQAEELYRNLFNRGGIL